MSEDNLNLEVTPFEDGLVLPLGSTEQIKLKELLKDVDSDILGTGPNGAYAISFNDSFDMTEQLTSLNDLFEIPDVDFSQKVSFQLNNVDVSEVKVEAQDYAFEHELSTSVDVPEISVPAVSEKFEVAAGMADYAPDASELKLSFDPIDHESHFMSISDDLHIPAEQINDIPIPVDGELLGDFLKTTPEFDIHEMVPLKITLPEGVNSVKDVVLHEGAAMKVTLALKGNFLHSGKLIPKIDVDLHNLFHLEESYGGDVAHLADDFILSEENGYNQSRTYGIASLAITEKDWTRKNADSPLVLDKSFEIPAVGTIDVVDLMTTTRHIEFDRNIDIQFTVEFLNLQIDDIEMGIDPVTISQTNDVELSMGNLEVPAEIEKISNVTFTQESGLDIVVKAQNLAKVKGLSAKLETLSLAFPEELSVVGADADNKITISNVDLSKGVSRHVRVTGINLPDPVDGKIAFSENIKVEAIAKASGSVHSSSLPSKAADDVKVLVDVASSIEVADYKVAMSGYDYDFDMEPEVISVEIPEAVAELNEVVVYLDGDPSITIGFDIPELPLDVAPSAEGINISFPEIIRFKQLDPSYNYDLATNSITLRGAFPDEVVLPVEKLVLTPVQNPEDGKYYAEGEVDVKGGVVMASGLLTKSEVESLSSAGKISVVAHIPELVPSTLALDRFETSIREEIALEIFSAEDVPAELVALGKVELEDDTYINISLDASALPKLGDASLSVNLAVDLPDMIKVAGADESGNISLSGTLDETGMINIAPIKVESLDFTGKTLENGICDVVVVDGAVILTDAALDVDEWLKKDLNIDFKAGISDIKIEKLTANVDYKVDPVVEAVDLSDFSSMLGDMGAEANFDFNRAHIAVDVTTNLGVPVKASVELIPYYNGKADESKAVPATLVLDPAASTSEEKVTRFWLANNDESLPAGHTFVKTDILSLLRNIPEKIEFRLDAGTDPSRESVLEPAADYILKANYNFELPLEFGEDFEITYRDTISGMPEILGSILAKGSKVKLAGEISNALPLGLDLRLNFLDSNGKVVPLADGCGVQTIAPCNLDATASKTPLEIVLALKDGASADIASIELMFNANAAGVSGIPVTEDAYLQAVLQLVLPEGISIDLNEIMNEE